MALEMVQEIVRGVVNCVIVISLAWALRGIFGK